MAIVARGFFRGLVAAFLATSFVCSAQDVLCGQYENITDPSNTYTVNNNVWGRDSSGASCVSVASNATTLSTTWSWSANETLVHAFPNINYNPIQRSPIQMSNLGAIDVKVSWSMKPAASSSDKMFDKTGLTAVDAHTNVAFDMFFDTQLDKAVNTTAPSYEVMVWIGKFGAIAPVGVTNNVDQKKLPTQKVGKQTFTLYQGANDNGQYVFTWIASSNVTDFEGDISPLVNYLWQHGMVVAANHIGVIQFGTEQKFATSNVTFSIDEYSLNATTGTPKTTSAAVQGLPQLPFVYTVAMAIATCGVWLSG